MLTSRTTARTVRLALALTLCAAGRVAAQGDEHRAHGGGLGTVHFATSCRPAVAAQFDRAVALLHSFVFGPAIAEFEAVLAADPTCAMAHWGIALARWSNPMDHARRPPALLARGRQAVDAARSTAATERERGYVEAVAALYDDQARPDQAARLVAYELAMADVARRHPADDEAKVFHALALVGAAAPNDKSYAKLRRAGAILEPLWAAQPEHPGLAHYIIHAYDVPALAPLAARAARRYAGIAPATAHALHMPSHTFTRLGLWGESAATNRRSAEAAARDSSLGEVLHAWDYLVYAYLQTGRDSDARAVLDALPAVAARYDPTAVRGAAPGTAGMYALAAIPARYALERRAWPEAAALAPRSTAYPRADAVTYFAHALGSARAGRPAAARAAGDSLGALRERLLAQGETHTAEEVAIQRLSAQAWLAAAEGRRDDALTLQREAAAREDATEKSGISPGPLAPARELLGDLLLEFGRPREALAEYRRTAAREPGRLRTLDGARRAAAAAGDRAMAATYAAAVAKLTAPAAPGGAR